jgi:hypothetical protein
MRISFLALAAILVMLALPAVGQTTAPAPPAAAVLVGHIADGSGNPLPEVRVVAYGGIATRWQIAETATDASGDYRFDPAPVGASIGSGDEMRAMVGLRIEHPDWASADGLTWWDITFENDPGNVVRKDFVLTPAGTLAGTVTHSDGRPAADLNLRVVRASEGEPLEGEGLMPAYPTTEADGTFRAEGLFPGEYIIEINGGGYPHLGPATVEPRETTTVHLIAPEP